MEAAGEKAEGVGGKVADQFTRCGSRFFIGSFRREKSGFTDFSYAKQTREKWGCSFFERIIYVWHCRCRR
jgi:hypothetical protein